MNILAQTVQKNYTHDVLSTFTDKYAAYIVPLSANLSSLDYGQFISSLSDVLSIIGCETLTFILTHFK